MPDTEPFGQCPKCGSPIVERFKSFTCTNEDCDFTIWKTIAGRLLSREEFETLVRDKQTEPLGGFRSRKGKRFHVHLLIQPWPKRDDDKGNTAFWPLDELLHSIKSFSAHEINEIEKKSGSIWQKERLDRYVRSDSDLQEKFHYILRNPWDSGVARQNQDYP